MPLLSHLRLQQEAPQLQLEGGDVDAQGGEIGAGQEAEAEHAEADPLAQPLTIPLVPFRPLVPLLLVLLVRASLEKLPMPPRVSVTP